MTISYHWADQVLAKEIPYFNTVFLLGTGDNGPVNQPKQVTSPEQAKRIFGEEGTLTKGFMQAYGKYPDLNYYLVKVTGEYARLIYYTVDSVTGEMAKALSLRSKGAADKYNQIKIVIENTADEGEEARWALVFYPPEEMGQPIAYFFNDFPTFGQLVQAINNDADYDRNFVYANTKVPLARTETIMDFNEPERYLVGGASDIDASKDEMYIALHTTYEILEGRGIHVIVPLGVYFDDVFDPTFYGSGAYGSDGYTSDKDVLMLVDTYTNKRCTFHEQLIDFCRSQQKFGFVTHGVLGMRPFTDDLIANYSNLGYLYTSRLLQVTAFNERLGLSETSGSRVKDKGWYISIFSGDILFNEGTNLEHWDNGAVVYACMLCKSGVANHTTNMPVGADTITNRDGSIKIPRFRPEYTSTELKFLSKLGVVTCRQSPKYGLVVHNGVTPALPDSEYHDIANVKMVMYSLWFLNRFLKSKVGTTVPRDWSVLHKEISDGCNKIMNELKQLEIILDGEITVERTTSTWWKTSLRLAGKYTLQDLEVPMEVNLNNGSV